MRIRLRLVDLKALLRILSRASSENLRRERFA